MRPRPTLSRLIALLLLPLGLAAAAHADDLSDARSLLRRGESQQAMEKVQKYLATKPGDAQGRFLQGLILSEQNKPDEAMKVFRELTQDNPELPEPYNNLAVLYAARGQYREARDTLEMAVRTNPNYAVAHENLGDVYARLASQSYEKALTLDANSKTARAKLTLARDLVSYSPRSAKPAATPPAK